MGLGTTLYNVSPAVSPVCKRSRLKSIGRQAGVAMHLRHRFSMKDMVAISIITVRRYLWIRSQVTSELVSPIGRRVGLRPPRFTARSRSRASRGQDVVARIEVPIHDESAMRTVMHPHGQVLRDDAPASGAHLRRPAGIDLDDRRTGAFRCTSKTIFEYSPRGVVLRAAGAPPLLLNELLDVDILHRDEAIILVQLQNEWSRGNLKRDCFVTNPRTCTHL